MRFGLPDDDRDPQLAPVLDHVKRVPHVYGSRCNTHSPIQYSAKDEVRLQFERINNEMKAININSDNQNNSVSSVNLNELNKPTSDASTINIVKQAISHALCAQNSKVERIVTEELDRQRKERIAAEERRKAEEARRKAEEERRKAEEEKRKAEEAKRKAEEEKRRAEEAKRKAEEEKRRVEEEKRKAEEEKRRTEEEKRKAEEETLRRALEQQRLLASWTLFERVASEFAKYKKDIADIKANVVAKISADPVLKKQAGALRRQINPRFGQLTNSTAQLARVCDSVAQLISLAQPLELGYKWVLNFVAKAIVDQAETEVTVLVKQALPLARLAMDMMARFPEFEYFLTARLVKKCPFIIGYLRTIDTVEGRLAMGWRRKDGDKWEDEVKYDERLSGIATLWAVMTRLEKKQTLDDSSKYSYAALWRFAARMANTPLNLLTNAHYSVVNAWWEALAEEFVRQYNVQGTKLMALLLSDWVAQAADRKFPAAARLTILGEDWTSGKFKGIPEMER